MGIKEKLGAFKDTVAQLKSQGLFPAKMGRLDKILISFVLSFMGLGLVFIGASLSWMISELRQKSASTHAVETAEHHADSHDDHRAPASEDSSHENPTDEHADPHASEHDGGHGDSGAVAIGGADIPKSITDRQDGIRAEGYDLEDPEIKQEKGLAGLLEQDLKVSVGYRTVDIHEIISGSKMGDVGDASVYLDATFEVDSFEAQKEIEDRKTEIKSMVSSLITGFSAETLRTVEGKQALKVEIFKEVNRLMLAGQITDVLFTNIMIR